MGLLNEVEKRSAGGRIFKGLVVFVLGIGAVTMVYPFLLMLSTSLTTDMDYREYRLIPRYLTDDTALFRLFLHTRYGAKGFAEIRAKYRLGTEEDRTGRIESYEDLKVEPALRPEWGERPEAVLRDWDGFVRQLPEFLTRPYYVSDFLDGKTQIEFQEFLERKFNGDIAAFNRHVEAILPYPEFYAIDVPANTPGWHTWLPETTPLKTLWREFKRALPYARINPVCMDQYYQFFLESHYKTLDKLNQAWGARYNAFAAIELPDTAPPEPERRKVWARFVRLQFPWYYMRVKGDHTAAWRRFLVRKYGSEAQYDDLMRRLSRSDSAAPLPVLARTVFTEAPPENEFLFKHWGEYIDAEASPEDIGLLTIETQWRAFLEHKYGDIWSLNEAHGGRYADFRAILPPWRLADVWEFLQTRGDWRRYFVARNYRNVMVFITTKGRALLNTFILVVLTVVGQLVVQSAAAFALSRYKLSYAHKVILFLLATMAFPAEVAMIPGFLLLRNLGLLNTFAALVLPGLCSGIGILWLKGYFDSLSKELFEAALIDGASEFQIFRRIVLPLAKPVLAVVALGSFTAAYTGFMWAFVTCQDPKMWTLMVWLYQFQARASVPAQMASFVVTSIPTLLVFVFCQNIIMRGIVVPTMK